MLRAEHISYAYNGYPVIADLTLECRPGEIVGIVGASGSGKTTALNIFSGYLEPRSGHISVNGISPKRAAQEQAIGYVFQSPTLFPWATVYDNVAMPLKLKISHLANGDRDCLSDDSNKERVQWALEMAQIDHAASKYPHELSGGMKTRAAIARAIVYKPKLLLLDEATTGLDDIVKEALYPMLQEVIAATQAATVIVGHDLGEILLLCDRVYVLKSNGHSSYIVDCEIAAFRRPRSVEVFDDPDFIAARKHLRESLS